MDPSKKRASIFFLILSIPIFYFLTIKNNDNHSTLPNNNNKDTKKTTIEASTQTIAEYVTGDKVENLNNCTTKVITKDESEPDKLPETHPSKRILDYFTYFVSRRE